MGRIRDRVILLGRTASDRPTSTASTRCCSWSRARLLEREPLSEAPELAWHAYAIEYGLRVRSRGLRVCATDIPLTHNSITVNLDRLDVAYEAVAASYPDSCRCDARGVRTSAGRARAAGGILAAHRWRYRWLRESAAVLRERRAAGGGACVLGDIRRDIDDVLARSPGSPLLVVNLEHGPPFADERPGPLELPRRGRPIMLTASSLSDAIDKVAGRAGRRPSLFLTNPPRRDLRAAAPPGPSPACWAFAGKSASGCSSEPRRRRCPRSGGRPRRDRPECGS